MSESGTEVIDWDCDPAADTKGGAGQFTVPAGEYALTVLAVMRDQKGRLVQRTKNGDPKINLKLGINGTNGKKYIFHNINFLPKNNAGHFISVHAMKCLGVNIEKGALVNFRPSELVGRVVRAKLVLGKKDPADKYEKNWIDDGLLYPKEDDKPEIPTTASPAARASEPPSQTAAHYEDVPF